MNYHLNKVYTWTISSLYGEYIWGNIENQRLTCPFLRQPWLWGQRGLIKLLHAYYLVCSRNCQERKEQELGTGHST